MKSNFLCLLALLLIAGCSKPKVEADYQIVPLPQTVNSIGGQGFELNGKTLIIYQAGNEVQKQTATFLSEYIKYSTGLELSITDTDASDNAIILKTGYEGENAEAYSLTVNANRIVIDGACEAGVFYGVQTLRKAIPVQDSEVEVVFPAVEIKDYPRFGYRGMHLDVSRHFFPLDFVKKYIDILALHNINRFHWHLSDDQGWRIEIKKYPELTKIGSQRAQTLIEKKDGEYDGKPYGGYFTQNEAREVVEYAAKRFITVIPEIDLPGHMQAALASYPELGCTGGPYKVAEDWGVFEDVLCAGNDTVYTFLENVFSEIIEIFPSEYIHVGGDECPKARWKECPKCQAKIKALKLAADATHTKEDRLQSHMIGYVEKFLNSKGRQIIGWDEILEGGLAPNATVMSWRGVEGGIEAAKQHHDVIMSPNSYIYFDYYQGEDKDSEPLAFGGYLPVQKVYSLEPVSKSLADDEKKYIIGAQANMWTEYINNTQQVEYMLMPRIAALSEVQWCKPENKDYEKFLPRLAGLMKYYKKMGYNYATHITEIAAEIKPAGNELIVKLFTYDNAPVYYTLDGSEPTEKSTKYEEPLHIGQTADIKAVAYRDNEKSKIYEKKLNFNKATLKGIELVNPTHQNYAFNPSILVDGRRGSGGFASAEWLGFFGNDFIGIVDLGEVQEISKVVTGTYEVESSWIFGAVGYTVAVSEDGKAYKQVYDESYPVMDKVRPTSTVDLTAQFTPVNARYVKITAKNTGTIPDWHAGKGTPAFLFIDEIMIE
ncbi:glycoside hydrolase family 20 protein [Dysgonomonas sp. 511]|uniref:glycoside hydrolase family 20 protein n=1 Tax=Dysgonomonas sp. 511 TaxID=2302930 RepID=UPI0013D232A5|nr:glycoside hydrolase family 20 protein [Dysgonomonas sp. 511]NDV79555.1 beta-N-acetylhexosaminidase [Dysgonomonas sp. 511]